MQIKGWRAGFELEVILGDLGNKRFAEDGPLDEASPDYCRETARQLRARTSYPWRARHTASRSTGFWVLSEYGLDPIDWPMGRIGGVELLTPPLQLAECDRLRVELSDAIFEIDEDFNFWSSDITDDCAWHINVDSDDVGLDPATFAYCVDEIAILAANDRLWNSYASPQRHAYGPALLRHLSADPNGILLRRGGLGNLILENCGRTKGFAANFGKLQSGYLELRHFKAVQFFEGTRTEEVLRPIIDGLAVPFSQESPFRERFLQRFDLVVKWLVKFEHLIETRFGEYGFSSAPGEVSFAGQPLCQLGINGTAQASLILANGKVGEVVIHSVQLADVPERMALLALDLAELRNLGTAYKAQNSAFDKSVRELATKLRKSRLTHDEHDRLVRTSKLIRDSGKCHAPE